METLKTVKKSEFGRIMGVSPGRVTQWIDMGLPVMQDGTIPLEVGQAWCKERVSDRGRPRKSKPAEPSLESQPPEQKPKIPDIHLLGGDVQKIMEALKLPKVEYEKLVLIQRREKLELDNLTKKGLLVARDEVESAAFDQARVERDALLNWPSRISPILAAELEVNERKLYHLLERCVREFLDERPLPEHLLPESKTA